MIFRTLPLKPRKSIWPALLLAAVLLGMFVAGSYALPVKCEMYQEHC